MTPVLYSAGETQFNHMGIGTLADSISAHATEERNGAFELEFGYPVNGPLFNELQKDRIIKAKSNDDANMDPQLFRIYYISKPINGQCQYKAEHVSYELGKNPITSVNVTGTAQQFMNAVLANTLFPHRFTAISDDPTTSSSNLIRVSAREAFGGTTGSLIQIWGGELTFDNWLIRHSLNRGTDTGIIVGYGKNLTDLNQEEAIDTAYTSIYPYATIQVPTGEGDDTTTTDQVIELPEKKVESQYVGNYAYGRCLPVDLSGDDVTDEASLRAKAQQYIVSNDIGKPTVNLTVSFINLWQTEEYKSIAPLEHINLCDYVTVRFKKLGVDVKAKVIKTDYDVLAERYLSVELGDPKSNLADDINGMQSSIADVSSTANQAAKTSGYALIQANGKNRNFYSETFPTEGMIKNDILFMKVNGQYLKKYHYDGIQWVLDVSADANDALEAANQAMESANGKTKVFRQAAEPTGELQDNYIWFRDNPDGTITQFTYKNGEWSDPQLAGVKAAQDQANTAVATAQTAAQDAATGITIANAANSAASAAQQTASDAYNQASTAETNAQTAINNASSALSAANAANANANTREKSIIKSSTAPSSPVTDQLWIDTSTTPQLMKRWSGSVWITLSPTQASQIGAVSTTTYTTDITNINNTLSQKASVSTVNTLTGRVDTAETNIAQNANAIALKASQSSVDTLTGRVSTAETNITANATAITSKANQSTVDTITGRVSTAESTITQQADQIAARITTVNADAKYATQTALMATSSSLTSSISSVQTNLNLVKNAGNNLVTDCGFEDNSWPGTTTEQHHLGGKSLKLTANGNIQDYNVAFIKTSPGRVYYFEAWVLAGQTTWSGSVNIAMSYNQSNGSSHSWPTISGLPNNGGQSWTKLSGYTQVPDGYDLAVFRISVRNDVTSGNVFYFDDVMVMDVTDSQALKTSTDSQFSQLSQTVDGISTTVSQKVDQSTYNTYVSQTATTLSAKLNSSTAASTYATQTSLTATSSSLQTNINAKVDTTTYNSKISQLSSDINLRVSKNDVVNQINVSTESILIAGNKVHITGQTTIDSAVITNAMIATLDAGKITTGTLSANRIGANTITTDKLNVANLAAISQNVGTITAGSLNSVNINAANITGTTISGSQINGESITSGIISSDRIAANSIKTQQINVGDFTNLCINPNFQDSYGNVSGAGWGWSFQWPSTGDGGSPSKYYGGFRGRDGFCGDWFTVTPGEKFYCSMFSWLDGGSSFNGNFNLGLISDDGNGGNTNWFVGCNNWDGQHRSTEGILTIPNGYIRAKVWVQIDANDNFPLWWATSIVVRRAMKGNLIVDGTIQGVTINGNTINGGTINGTQLNGSNFYQNANGFQTWLDGNGFHQQWGNDTHAWIRNGGINVSYSPTNEYVDIIPNRINVHGEGGGNTDITGYAVYSQAFNNNSREELKTEITTLDDSIGLALVNNLDIYKFKYKSEVASGRAKYIYGGIIGDGYRLPDDFKDFADQGVNLYSSTFIGLKAIQELTALHQQDILKIAELESRISELEKGAAA